MERYIKGINRNQVMIEAESLDDKIEADNEIRVIDAYVDSLDMKKLKFKRAETKNVGTLGYDPRDMLKLYLYAYKRKIRSSRKIEEACRINIEVMWLVNGIRPNFRSIADFRKDNIEAFRKVFVEFNIICKNMDLITGKVSQDGVKIKAVNSKDKNYTLNKLDDRIERIQEKIEYYLRKLDEKDKVEEEKLVDIETMKKRKEEYEKIRKELEESGNKQKSITDPESKLMKNNGKFDVAYNNQVVVDVNSHIISGYEVSDSPADVGKINEVGEKIQEELGLEIITNVTDKGYNDRKDMMKSLENGIIPQVTPQEEVEEIELETEYEEKEISEEERKSRKKEDIKKCIRAGVIPEAYKEVISEIKIEEREEVVLSAEEEEKSYPQGELKDYAMENNCFVRDKETGRVYCPMGEILREKSKHRDGKKYCNKLACKNCKNPCTEAKFKEVVFKEGQVTVGEKNKKRKKTKKEKKKIKKVVLKLKIDKELLSLRMGTSEHPHGTMKRWDGFDYFLLKGKKKVEGELAIYYCATNIRRAINILGIAKVIEGIKEYKKKKNEIGSEGSHFFMLKFWLKLPLPQLTWGGVVMVY